MWESLFLATLAFMFLAETMARQRRRSVHGWLWTTAMVGPFGPLALLALGARPSRSFPA